MPTRVADGKLAVDIGIGSTPTWSSRATSARRNAWTIRLSRRRQPRARAGIRPASSTAPTPHQRVHLQANLKGHLLQPRARFRLVKGKNTAGGNLRNPRTTTARKAPHMIDALRQFQGGLGEVPPAQMGGRHPRPSRKPGLNPADKAAKIYIDAAGILGRCPPGED